MKSINKSTNALLCKKSYILKDLKEILLLVLMPFFKENKKIYSSFCSLPTYLVLDWEENINEYIYIYIICSFLVITLTLE